MILIQLEATAFETFARQFPGSFMQSIEMAKLYKKRGFTTYFLGLEINQELQVAGLVYTLPMTGGLHMEINSGPLSRKNEYLKAFYRELQIFAKEKGALQLLVKPYDTYQTFDSQGNPTSPEKTRLISDLTDLGYQHDGLLTGYPNGEPDWHYVKDLTNLTPETLIQSFNKKGRPQANKALSFGIRTKVLTKEELHLFKAITAATSERRDYTDKSLDYYQDFYDSFGDKAQFMIATIQFQDYLDNLLADHHALEEKLSKVETQLQNYPNSAKHKNISRELNNQIETFKTRISEAQQLVKQYGQEEVVLAGALFIYLGNETAYLFSGSYPEFNRFYAPMVLQYEAMAESLKRNLDTYNFLGITGEFDGTDSVLRFKQQFSGYITRKTGTFRYYPRPLKFKFLQALKKLLGR
ncbi:aminoacyltransferase [Streptococcus ovuberis]|uniref:Aminoacyltransferase FemA n=1 Tax=Streptococcus ovuberis TaxID=1936207 RepID=A0A7X6MVT6_9STRE|nr:aminoacyltransferase [Streptococcus ovuberis]NKZ19332.1 aminoacyltransferase [Streptococcus ovuberis]